MPDAKAILQASMEEIDTALSRKMTKGQCIEEENGNKFVALKAKVTSIQEIQSMYLKLKLTYPDARHIICAYRIPGEKTHECEDYVDDNDYNAGHTLLTWMIKQKITVTVYFIVRYRGKTVPGKDRYRLMIEAAENILEPGRKVEETMYERRFTGKKQKRIMELNKRPYTIKHSVSRLRGMYIAGRNRGAVGRGMRGGGSISTPSRRPKRNETNHRDFQFSEPENALDENEWPKLTYATKTKNSDSAIASALW